MPRRSLFKIVGYWVLQQMLRLGFILCYRYRCAGQRHLPDEGAVLVCSNHQSFFDPPLVGMPSWRRFNYMARKSLFNLWGWSWLFRFLDAIPVDREGGGLEGLKESLRRLRDGEIVLVFPEGTRTTDGTLAPFKPGLAVLARRGKAAVLPAAIAGAFEAWPRGQKLPGLGVIHVCYGPPLLPADIARLSDDELLREIERRVAACYDDVRESRRQALS